MAYFTSLWKARIIEKCKNEYENEKLISILASNTEIPRKTSMMQKWRIYRRDTKTRMTGKLKKWFPEGSSVSNLYRYLKTDQTFPNFVLKSVVGFLGGIVLTYLCFMFFVFQLSISLIHATIMSSVIGVLLTLGLAFSYRIRCLVFLLIPQLFSRVGRYTLTCYALVLILTGPATNTFKNSEVLSESMACTQEQIKTSVRQINESIKKPFNAMKDSVTLMVATMKRLTSTVDGIISRINVLTTTISDVIQSSLSWLNSVGELCTKKFGPPYDYCTKAIDRGLMNCKNTFRGNDWLCNASIASAKNACLSVKPFSSICFTADYSTTSFAATMKRKRAYFQGGPIVIMLGSDNDILGKLKELCKFWRHAYSDFGLCLGIELKVFTDRINKAFSIDVDIKHTYTFTNNASESASQIAAGIVTEIRTRADPLLTWLSWSSCVTSLFLLLIIFRAKYYQHMFETRSRFDNLYVTRELRELDLKRYLEGRVTILPLNKREQAKYINVTSFRLVTTEKLYLTRAMVFMTITTFKLLIHIVADYSLYWVLTTIRYHGRFQTILPHGPSDAGVHISGEGTVADLIRSIFKALTIPLVQNIPSPITCLPNPYPPDLQRYTQIAVLIMLLWFFALFEPYGLRLRHVIMGHYRPERAKARAVWLYNHILRTRGSFMKLARRKLHREYKYSNQQSLTFRHWINSLLPCWWLRYLFGTLPKEPHCLLCDTLQEGSDSDTTLISCNNTNCPGVYCARCYCDIGHLCTICMKPEDYGDLSDVSLETGSTDEDSDQEVEDNDNILIHRAGAGFTVWQREKRRTEYETCGCGTDPGLRVAFVTGQRLPSLLDLFSLPNQICLIFVATKNGVWSKSAVRSFPKGFLFGVSTSAYQIEGGCYEDGNGLSIWDVASHTRPSLIDDGTTGDVTVDSYHLYKRDIAMLKDLGVDFYRFSISWTRILPNGLSNHINYAGLRYYKKLINKLLENNITPFVTLYHWDLPHELQRLGGWTNSVTVNWFVDYAKVLFDKLGDRVKFWITINEPKQICYEGYGSDKKAPFLNMTGIAEYLCTKNILLAHAKVYHLYDEEYRKLQEGKIGIVINAEWFEPASDTIDDHQAALDARQFDWGLYAHPIFSKEGDYPAQVKSNVNAKSAEQGYPRSRLPELSATEIAYIRGTADFFGLSSYTTILTYRDASLDGMFPVPSFRDDMGAVWSNNPSWPRSYSSWLQEVPWGFRKLLLEIRKLYDNPPVYVMANGWSSKRGLLDEDRIRYMRNYLNALLDAVKSGCNVKAYATWSLMDSFEWLRGYTEKFGLYEVDFNSPDKTTTPRKSAFIYKEIIRSRKLDPNFEPDQYFEEREIYGKESQEQEKGKTFSDVF